MKQLGRWLLGLIVAVVLATAVTPADAQVDLRFGPHNRRYHHRRYHHRYYRHHRGYWRR